MKLFFILMLFFMHGILNAQRKNERSMAHKRYGKSPPTSPWIYKKTNPGAIQEHELQKLFRWTITPNRREYRRIQEKERKRRDKERVRGNAVFHRKKYSF